MSGLLFFGVIGLWIWIAYKLSRWLGGQLSPVRWSWPVAAAVFSMVLPLPVIDEIMARPQIDKLCREGAVFTIDEQKIKGKRVKYSAEPANVAVPDIAVPVTYTNGVLRDEATGEKLASRGSYIVKSGKLMHVLSFGGGYSPLFVRSYCAPGEGAHGAATRIGFTIVN